jgi:hypothetical protein
MPRKTSTSLPCGEDTLCPVFFVLAFDKLSFFMRCGAGICKHKGHPFRTSFEMRQHKKLLEPDNKALVEKCSFGNVPATLTQSILRASGVYMTKSQVRDIQRCAAMRFGNEKPTNDENEVDGSKISSTDMLFKFFKQRGLSHISLKQSYNSGELKQASSKSDPVDCKFFVFVFVNRNVMNRQKFD